MNSVIENLKWRYATKRMNGQKVPKEKIDTILKSIQLAATSNGLQPFSVFLIEDEGVRKEIQKVAFNQPQVVEASHLLVFAAWKQVSEERIRQYFELVYRERNMAPDALAQYEQSLVNKFSAMPENGQFEWAARQAYIALGTAMVAAAEEKVDATPMEGFLSNEIDRILELDKRGLGSVAFLALGYRDEATDHLINAKKVRRPLEQLVIKL